MKLLILSKDPGCPDFPLLEGGPPPEVFHDSNEGLTRLSDAPPIEMVLVDIEPGKERETAETARRISRSHDIPLIFMLDPMDEKAVEAVAGIHHYGFLPRNCGTSLFRESLIRAYELSKITRSGLGTYDKLFSGDPSGGLYSAIDALRKSEARFRDLASLLPQAVAETDLTGRLTFVNDNGLKMFGYTHDDLENGLNIFQLLPPEVKDDAFSVMQQVLGGQENKGKEYPVIRKDGSLLHVLIYSSPIIQENRAQGLRAIGVDITPLKVSEKRLKESEERYRFITDNISEIIYVTDPSGHIQFVSGDTTTLLGMSQEEMTGMHLTECFRQFDIPEEEVSRILSKVNRAVQQMDNRVEYIIPLRVGGSTKFLETFEQLIYDENGNLASIIGISRDISDRRRAEEELQEKERRLRTIFDNSPLGLVHLDREGTIVNCNQQFADIIGAPREKILGFNTIANIKNKKMIQCIRESLGGRQCYFEGNYLSQVGGRESYIRLHANPINPGTSPTEAIGAMEDISDWIQTRKEKEKIESHLADMHKIETIGRLAGGIAHDFNNILTPILGYSNIIRGKLPGDSPIQEEIGHIVNAAQRARDLVSQILTYGKKGEKNPVPVSMTTILEEGVRLLNTFRPQNIELILDHGEPGPVVKADPTQLLQIIMNLGTNAIQAMEGGGRVTFNIHELDVTHDRDGIPPGIYALLEVSDTGPGMDDSIRKQIFEPFFSTRKEGGTGLGLSVVKGIVSDYGGTVYVESEPGKGSRFKVYLPVYEAGLAVDSAEEEDVPPAVGGSILVVDDRKDVATTIQRMLDLFGYSAEHMTDSLNALEHLMEERDRYDLLITDLTMPGLDGRSLAERLHREKINMPVLLMTGYNDKTSEELTGRFNIERILLKPIMPDDLARAVREILENWKE
jgi:PAS domain S-box-containing protein